MGMVTSTYLPMYDDSLLKYMFIYFVLYQQYGNGDQYIFPNLFILSYINSMGMVTSTYSLIYLFCLISTVWEW